MTSCWHNRPVLVTGATGLLGYWLIDALVARGAQVVALVRDWNPQSELLRSGLVNRLSVVSGCLEDFTTLERALCEHEIDTVFHLGALTIVNTALRNPLATFEANIRGSYHLLEACRRQSDLVRRVVVASSDKAYGTCADLPYTEAMPLQGCHPYDVSKTCTDLLAQTYAQTYGLPVAITRCGNLYGGGDLNWNRLIPGTIRSLLRGEAPVVRSDGRFIRDYLYVKDAVAGYLAIAEALEQPAVRGQAFNLAPDEPRTVLEVIDLLRRVTGREELAPVILNQAKAEIRDQYLCSTKAHRLLGWQAQYSLEAGLRETVDWYADYLNASRVTA